MDESFAAYFPRRNKTTFSENTWREKTKVKASLDKLPLTKGIVADTALTHIMRLTKNHTSICLIDVLSGIGSLLYRAADADTSVRIPTIVYYGTPANSKIIQDTLELYNFKDVNSRIGYAGLSTDFKGLPNPMDVKAPRNGISNPVVYFDFATNSVELEHTKNGMQKYNGIGIDRWLEDLLEYTCLSVFRFKNNEDITYFKEKAIDKYTVYFELIGSTEDEAINKINENYQLLLCKSKTYMSPEQIPIMYQTIAPGDEGWLFNLKNYLTGFLTEAIFGYKPEENRNIPLTIVNDLLSDKGLLSWVEAFTSENYNPQINYEKLEFFGDRVLETIFSLMTQKNLPDMNEHDYTVFKAKYNSKENQSQLIQKFGFESFIRTKFSTRSIREDVFESFFGAIFKICRDLQNGGIGLGMDVALKVLNYFYMDFDWKSKEIEKVLEGDSITVVQQIFQRLGFPWNKNNNLEEIFTEVPSGDGRKYVQLQLKIGSTLFAFLNSLLPVKDRLKTQIIGVSAQVASKDEAKKDAYEKARNLLKDIGVTTKWSEEKKAELYKNDPELKPLIDEVEKKVRERGFETFEIQIPKALMKKGSYVAELFGVPSKDAPTNKKVELFNTTGATERTARIALLQQYLGQY